jgi:hypothetical protein
MRWDTKPDNRIRRTSPHPAPTRFEELLAGFQANGWPGCCDKSLALRSGLAIDYLPDVRFGEGGIGESKN